MPVKLADADVEDEPDEEPLDDDEAEFELVEERVEDCVLVGEREFDSL